MNNGMDFVRQYLSKRIERLEAVLDDVQNQLVYFEELIAQQNNRAAEANAELTGIRVALKLIELEYPTED